MSLLSIPAARYACTPWKLAIVTGLSNPLSCALSLDQQAFLTSLVEQLGDRVEANSAEASVVRRNFPFVSEAATPTRAVGLLRASLANYRQYKSCRAAGYSAQATPHWKALSDSATQVHLIAGSCGLELLAQGCLKLASTACWNVLALGPVANRGVIDRLVAGGRLRLQTIYGASDWIATRNISQCNVTIGRLGHLGYWTNHEVKERACEWLRSSISEFQDRAASFRRGESRPTS